LDDDVVDRIRRGETVPLPHHVEDSGTGPRLPSVHDPSWSDWSDDKSIREVWLDAAEKVDGRWSARLRVDGEVEVYELEILPGPVLREVRGPKAPSFETFTYDLHRLLLRMDGGERFALPFQLRPRWPTPPEPPALP
jgi:hypothetical protein